ncbi:MAG: hypothetical protein WA991_12295 [Ornithinimicrobium sp.]
MSRPRRYRRVVTGGSLTSLGLDMSLVPADGHHCQQLLSLIDNKDIFTAPVDREVSRHVLDSVKEVRTMATATEGLVDGEETYEEVHHIAGACRLFMRDYDANMDSLVFATALESLRAEVGGSLGVLVKILGLRPTREFDLTPYEGRATTILQGWLDRTP